MDFTNRYRVKPGGKVDLSKWDPDDTGDLDSKKAAKSAMRKNLRRLGELQYLLYAEGRRALLVVLQAMDAGGKDGTVRHVMGPLNPQSCKVTSFKQPTDEELKHDYLWRIHRAVPGKGEIGIFNRSHYEDVLVVRVEGLVPKDVWSRRYDQINAFEKMLAANEVHVVKFYLHVSKDEQLKRLRRRLADPTRQWKADPQDFEKRKHWDAYMPAYGDALSRCSCPRAPWYVIPANKKWFRNLAVSQILVEKLETLNLEFPAPAFDLSQIEVE